MQGDEGLDPKRILVVDDEAAMLRTHGRVLSAHGFRPILLTSPHEALKEALERMPAAMIIDLAMPEMSGLELAAQLRSAYRRAAPPLILVSGNHDQLSPMEQLLFDAIFPKPYAVDQLVLCVKRLVREHYERRRAPSQVLMRSDVPLPREKDGNT